jgi:hypothetical protein
MSQKNNSMKSSTFNFKTKLFIILLGFIMLSFQQENCDPMKLKKETQKELSPYKYDSSKLTKITYKNQPQFKEVEAELFIGEKYRIVINTTCAGKPIVVNIYNKDKEHSKRKLLYSSTQEPPDKKIFTYECSWTRRLYIDYEIPADSSNSNLTGSILLMVGYK